MSQHISTPVHRSCFRCVWVILLSLCITTGDESGICTWLVDANGGNQVTRPCLFFIIRLMPDSTVVVTRVCCMYCGDGRMSLWTERLW